MLLARRTSRLRADCLELVENPLPVLALALELHSGVRRLEQPEEERAEGGLASHAAVGCGLAEPAADLGEARLGQRVGAGVARPGLLFRDEPFLQQPGQLGIDLAVARGPGIGE